MEETKNLIEQENTDGRPSLKSKIVTAASAGGVSASAAALMGAGEFSLVIGAIGAAGALLLGQDVVEALHDKVKLPFIDERITEKKSMKGKRTFMERAMGWDAREKKASPPTVEGSITSVAEPTTDREITAVPEAQEEDLFSQEEAPQKLPFRRITLPEAIENTNHNSFQVAVGRSLTLPGGRARRINFRERHLKIIGASQKGKSSMAAYMITSIAETHDPWVVQFAILDLENRTGQLFEDIPHVACVKKDGQTVKLHARTPEEVLEHLGYICALVEYRYGLSLEQQSQQPLLIVYLEEFVFLKNHFRKKILTGSAEDREKGKIAFSRLMNYIAHISSRGLKVCVQLLICAQIEYRDEDVVEALANITDGFCYCLKSTAAQAAGFTQTNLLNKNYEAKQRGQCVVETVEFNDAILSPEFDLKVKLEALQKTQKQKNPVAVAIDIGAQERQSENEGYYTVPPLPTRETSPQVISMHGYRNTEDEASIQPEASSSMLDQALTAWNEGHTSIRQMAAVLEVSTDVAYQLICKLDAKGLIVREKRVKS